MPGLDTSIAFVPLRIAVLTVSDTRTADNDTSGQLLVDRIQAAGHILATRGLVRDEPDSIEAQLRNWIAKPSIEVIITTGGTGLTGRDHTPEVFQMVCEKEIPGFGELFRWLSFPNVGTSTIQSRATAGVANGTYLFALPGSNGAVKDGWDQILVHQLDIRHRPCNFAELIHRLLER
jgi:molybdopterin adenylyltransferase